MKMLAVIALALTTLGVTGCRQGLGQRCQTKDDCSPPLVCNMATQTCADKAGGDIDAQLPIDAGIDAPDAM